MLVRDRIEALAPAANIGHRGLGKTQPGNPFPENSVSSFQEAMKRGANGIELDVEITADGGLIVMHDDTLNRTTTCHGCVSEKTLREVRACSLRDGDGQPRAEAPPTLAETYGALPSDALINVELKVFHDDCQTNSTSAEALARAAVAEVTRLGALERTIFSSFDPVAVQTVRAQGNAYAALLLDYSACTAEAWPASLRLARDLDLDAIHPFRTMPRDGIRAALSQGIQVNVWTINEPRHMERALDTPVSSIITDRPGVLQGLLDDRPETQPKQEENPR